MEWPDLSAKRGAKRGGKKGPDQQGEKPTEFRLPSFVTFSPPEIW